MDSLPEINSSQKSKDMDLSSQLGNGDDSAFNSTFDDSYEKDEKPQQTLTRKEITDLLNATKDLRDLDIRKANLGRMDFSGCDLRGTNFSYSNLKDSIFKGADLRDASLWNANLEGVDFTDADLEGADLDYAKMRGAILLRANLRRASLPTELIPREDIVNSVQTGSRIGFIRTRSFNAN